MGILDLAGDPLLGVGILEPGDPGTREAMAIGILDTVLGEAGTFLVGLGCVCVTLFCDGFCTGLAIVGPFFELAMTWPAFLWFFVCPF